MFFAAFELPWGRRPGWGFAAGLLGLVGLLPARAQGPVKFPADPIKYGQIAPADLTPDLFADDSAAAVVLCGYGRARMNGQDERLQVVFERVTRVKILCKAGYDEATVEIPLYRRGGDQEKVPAGYEVAGLPKNVVVELPNGSARFVFSTAATGSAGQLTSRLLLNRSAYAAAQYADLRELYRLMLARQGEHLVLRKKPGG